MVAFTSPVFFRPGFSQFAISTLQRPLLAAILLLVTLCCVPSVRAEADAAAATALLSDMSKALREKDYRGLFTYEFGGVLQTMRVTHRVLEGEEYENVEYLNGPSRRVERHGRQVECLSAADQVLRGLLPGREGEASAYAGLQKNYQFAVREEERIAGRQATVVQVMPRDDYRYGYVLSIDKQTSLPLGAMIMAPNRKVLERLQFASLELNADDSWVDAVGAAALVKRSPVACETPADALDWALGWVPDGFVSAGRKRSDDVGEMQLYTDGLATFSVFMEPMSKNVAAQGKAQRGATVAYMQQHVFNGKAYTVTVVGEIPAVAAQRIASSIYWADEAPQS